jgi:hypothetical protein
LRARFSDKSPWTDIVKSIHDARNRGRAGTIAHPAVVEPAASGALQQAHNEAQR